MAPDGRPIYAETDFSVVFSEPWNAISSLAIVLPALYWAFRLKWQVKRYPFIFFCIPLLILGGLGSTLFHAFRSSEWLLLMDVLPTALLTFSVGLYFWFKVMPTLWSTLSVVLPFTGMRYAIYGVFQGHFAANLSYFISGVIIFLPLIIYLYRTKFDRWYLIFSSVGFLSLSLMCREMDMRVVHLLPMGSHFLWHLFSGFGAYFLAKYLFFIREKELRIA
ncbi:MAG: hypothetical protein AAGA85_17875 [Bacteroidota bacterium]